MPENVRVEQLDYVRIDARLVERAVDVLQLLKKRGAKAVSAESCTGGLIATVLSEAPGAAEHFEGGFVVYTPAQKFCALGIPPGLIQQHGTVSLQVAQAMAEGALRRSEADIAIGVTGVAGPETDERGNPVGLVYIGCAQRGSKPFHKKCEFGNLGRSAVRYAAATEALLILAACLTDVGADVASLPDA